jgi:lipopolysaccharide export system protein LptA
MGYFDSSNNSNANSVVVEKNNDMDETYFTGVDYYLLEKGKPFLRLESTELTISKQNTEVVGFNPDGIIYRRDEKGVEEDPIYFTSKNSRIFTANQELILQQDVNIRVANSILDSDKVTIFNGGRHLQADGNVRTSTVDLKTNDQILITSNFALYRPKEQFFEYKKNVKGTIKKKRQYEESVSFTTDLMTLEGLKSEVEMKGNVTFKKGDLDASSNQGTLFLENYNKRLKYYSLSDDVRLEENLLIGGKSIIRKAFAEKLEGLISDKKIILTGLPKVFQGKDVIKGNRITIRENIETVEVDDANTNITLERDKEQSL